MKSLLTITLIILLAACNDTPENQDMQLKPVPVSSDQQKGIVFERIKVKYNSKICADIPKTGVRSMHILQCYNVFK